MAVWRSLPSVKLIVCTFILNTLDISFSNHLSDEIMQVVIHIVQLDL